MNIPFNARSNRIAVCVMSLFAAMAARPDAAWNILPVFGGGYVQNVVIAPSNPSRWYAYVDVGGPYRSDDGGRSWRALVDSPPRAHAC